MPQCETFLWTILFMGKLVHSNVIRHRYISEITLHIPTKLFEITYVGTISNKHNTD